MNENVRASHLRLQGEKRLEAFARTQLEARFNGKFWTSPDVVLAEDITLDRFDPTEGPSVRILKRREDIYKLPIRNATGFSATAHVTIDPRTLPGNATMMREEWEQLPVSVRSILAQTAGFEVGSNDKAVFIASDEEYRSIDFSKPFTTNVMLWNFAARPLELKAGMRLFRYVYVDERLRLTGRALYESAENGQIKIGGEPGVDWQWAGKLGAQGVDEITGIFARVRDDARMWIEPSDEPITLSDQTCVSYRANGFGMFVPAPVTDNPILSISETYKIGLSSHTLAVLDRMSYRYTHEGRFIPIMGYHINSRFIDPGSKWPIRVELRGPTTAHSEWVLFYFYDVPAITAA